uniref:Uncharacterized protein n=1 Tax=Trichogramma kaykai TaxID=54128 RepID=A0ABD2VV92_9HYME
MSVAVQGSLEITTRAASQITRETSLFSSYSRSYVYTRGARPAVYIIYNTRYLTSERLHERNVVRTPTHTCILWPILDTWQATSHGQPKREMLHADMAKATIDVPFMNESKSISRSWLYECIGLAKLVRLCDSEGKKKSSAAVPPGYTRGRRAVVERGRLMNTSLLYTLP